MAGGREGRDKKRKMEGNGVEKPNRLSFFPVRRG